MGIVVKGKEVVAIYYGKIAVGAVYKGRTADMGGST